MTDQSAVLLTIDCDWAVTPTPFREAPNQPAIADEPDVTFEHVRYPYDDRPDDARHGMCITPAGLVAALRTKGLPERGRAAFSERHGGVREAWADVQSDAATIVCLDAHLDMYAVGHLAVTLPGADGTRRRVTYEPTYREMGAGMPALAHLGPAVAASTHAAAWEQSWALLLLDQMPRLERFVWVVPDHFAVGLAAGFPYPHAQWPRILDAGRTAGIWQYTPDPEARQVALEFREPELAGRRLTIEFVTLADCPSLAAVDAQHLHVCRSPGFLHPAADQWVDELLALLNES